jgi:GNAT superfamily N-acetyltransferase
MIKTVLTRDDALNIMALGRRLHQESRFSNLPYNEERCWMVLQNTLEHPDKYFIAFDEEYHGFILMVMTEEFFSGTKWSGDRCLYVAPEHRGGSLVVRLLDEAYKWSKEHGAEEMVILHNTGINTDTAPKLFNKLGFDMKGYIFVREIQ